MTRWRATPMLLATAMAFLLTVPVATAADDRVLGADIIFTDPISMDRLEVVSRAERGSLGPEGGCLDDGTVVMDETRGFFRFRDTDTDVSCAEVQARVHVPEGVDAFTMRFWADRSIQQSTAATVPPNAEQSVRFYDDMDMPLAQVQYVDPEAGPMAGRSFSMTPAFDLPAREMVVGWYFADKGTSFLGAAAAPLPGQSLAATVGQPELEYAPLPAKVSAVDAGASVVGEDRFSRLAVSVQVDGGALGPWQTGLQVRTVEGFRAERVVAPDGTEIPADSVETRTDGTGTSFRLSHQAIAAHGAGTYQVVLLGTSALDPAHIGAIAGLALLLPGVAGILAVDGLQRYRRTAAREQAPSVVGHAAGLGATVVVYGATVAWILLGRRLDDMAVLPVRQTGWIAYSLVLLLLVTFLVLWGLGMIERRRSREIRHADDLTRSNRDLEQFAYVASHDLQEPLRKVVSYTGLLEKRYGEQMDDKARKYLQNASDGARRMRRLIQALLEFSRTGAVVHLETVDLNHAVDAVADDLEALLDETGGKVVADHHLPKVQADRELVHELLLNLVSNGIKYRHAGRDPVVRVRARRLSNAWEVAVEDNGRGMDEEYLEKVFVIFQRLHQEDGAVAGTGIGLALCQRIVENHGGRIWARSAPGAGSTFYFTLPVAGAKP